MAYAKLRTATAVYDFSTMGGTVGAIGLGVYIPKGAIVVRAVGQTITTITSGGSATIAIAAGATAILAATAYNAAGITGVDILNAFSTPLALASNGEITWTIAVADLTAGKYAMYIDYLTPTV